MNDDPSRQLYNKSRAVPAQSAAPADEFHDTDLIPSPYYATIILCLLCGILGLIVAGWIYLSTVLPAGFGLGP